MAAEVNHTMTHVQKSQPQYRTNFQSRVRAEPTGVGEGLELNVKYFISLAGILKLVQIVSAINQWQCIKQLI